VTNIKMEEGRHEEDGRIKVFKFEFFVFLSFGFGLSTSFIFLFWSLLLYDSSSTLSKLISVIYHVIICLSHMRFCNK